MAKKDNPTREEPLTLESLKKLGALDKYFSPPEGPFAPTGAWENTYSLWLVQAGESGGGALRIKRTPAPNGKEVELDVTQDIRQSTGSLFRTKAKVRCAADALATPLSWELESAVYDTGNKIIAETTLSQSAKVEDGKIKVTDNGKALTREAPRLYTSNWSLFDAIQRLPNTDKPAPEFSLLEDLDLRKDGQRITAIGAGQIEAGGKTIRVHGFQHVGRAILPYRYWLDGQNRLLVAISGIRAYLYAPAAFQRLAQLAARKGKGKVKSNENE